MKNEMYLNVTLTFLFACLMASTTSAQWVDSGTYITTDDNVNIGTNSVPDRYSLYVRTNKAGWQGRFANRNGVGADIYLAHGNGYGMNIVGRTSDNKYTLRLARGTSLNGEGTHVFYNDGRAALGLQGNVGIGTSTPAVKLHSTGTVRASNAPDNLDEYLEIGHGGWNSYINHKGNGSINFRFQGTNKMVLAPNGRLGIGTDAPTEALHVDGNIMLPDGNGTNRGNLYLGGKVDAGEIGMRLYGGEVIGGAFPGGFIDVRTDSPSEGLRFRIDQSSGTAERMRIRADGKVVIGGDNLPTPGNFKLYVDNGILTEEVKVATVNNWADYVFEEDYDLNSTEEVETFIKENKHLPNVPSAKQVSENGISMAEMDATLLRQVEELWLHIIELKKEVSNLKAENTLLKSNK